jgi:hypothetical protein
MNNSVTAINAKARNVTEDPESVASDDAEPRSGSVSRSNIACVLDIEGLVKEAVRAAGQALVALEDATDDDGLTEMRAMARARRKLRLVRSNLRCALAGDIAALKTRLDEAPASTPSPQPAVTRVAPSEALENLEEIQRLARGMWFEAEEMPGAFADGHTNPHACEHVENIQKLFVELSREVQLVVETLRGPRPVLHVDTAAE